MGKITQEQRNRYFEKVKEHRKTIEAGLAKEKTLLDLLSKDETGAGYKRLKLANDALDLCSWYMLVNGLSVSLLGIKNEDYLLEARKTLVRAIKYIEDTVSSLSRCAFSDYEAKLEEIKDFDPEGRFRLLRKLGFAVQSLEDAFGENSKYSASFIEAVGQGGDGRQESRQPEDSRPGHGLLLAPSRTVMSHLSLVKQLLQRCADKYREQYELYTHKVQDFRAAVIFLQALRRIHIVLSEREEAETLKRKAEIWSTKLEADFKKAEEAKK